MNEEIDIFKCLDYIRDNSKKYAQALRLFLYSSRYTLLALAALMATQIGEPEIYAYAHPDYTQLLEGIKEAIEAEENLRWKLIAAQAKIEVWRSLSANQRAEAKVL